MVKKKKKRRRKTKKVTPKGFFLFGTLFSLGCLIILGSFFCLSNSISRNSSPVYEEIYSISSDLNDKIGHIDYAIYESLYQKGVEEKDVFFTAVKPRHEKDNEWDFTELFIKLPDKNAALQLEKIINNELSKFKPAVGVENKDILSKELVCHVFTLGLYTHKIRLSYKGYKEEVRKGLPKISIIIDDIGYDNELAISFMNFDLPLSLSVLPLAPYTKDIAEEANRRGCDLLLHIPMEPKNYPSLDSGPGTLLAEMNEEEIRKLIGEHINNVPGVKGVNHHMGSYFTERYDKMTFVLRELKKRNLFYVDSRTTSRTVAFKLAKKMGVPVAKKSVFLDNDLSSKAIKVQMERLMGIARYSGTAVGIGHPHKETLRILGEYLDQLKNDFKVVPVSELVN